MRHLLDRYLPLLAITVFLLTGCTAAANQSVRAQNGVLDLTGRDLNDDESVRLMGQWEFYWNRLLEHKDLSACKPDIYADVPNVWNAYRINNEKLPGEGYATYRLKVTTTLPEGTMLGLKLYSFSSAYRLYINEKLVAQNGQVGTAYESEWAEYRPNIVFFRMPSSEFDIIIQVSNFHHGRGGFWNEVYLGTEGVIAKQHEETTRNESFLLGVLVITSLYHLVIFVLRKDYRYSLYFALAGIFMALLVDSIGEMSLLRGVPGIGFNLSVLLWFSSSIWFLLPLTLYYRELFPSVYSNVILKIYLTYFVVVQSIYVFTNPTFYGKLSTFTNIVELSWVFSIVIIIIVGIRKNYKDGWINLFSMLIACFAYTRNMLSLTNVIHFDYGQIRLFSIFIFVFIQMAVQAARIKQFQERMAASELAFLQSQIKPHFLYNALSTFVSISRYDPDKARELLINFSDYLRRSFDFKALSQYVPLADEIELAKAYIEIEKARFEDRIAVDFDITASMGEMVPILVLQPVIENAIIHGILPKPEGGRIHISIRENGNYLVFKVKDNGIGMDEIVRANVLIPGKGNGVGLPNIDSRLRRLTGRGIVIQSRPDAGTEVTWYIQVKERRALKQNDTCSIG